MHEWALGPAEGFGDAEPFLVWSSRSFRMMSGEYKQGAYCPSTAEVVRRSTLSLGVKGLVADVVVSDYLRL